MKKRVLSALLVLCMACSMVSTVWATEVTSSVTSGAGTPASQTVGSTATGTGDESGADSTGAPSDSTDSTSASSDSTSSGSSSAASDTTSGAVSDATSGEGDESTASSDSTAASDSTSSSSSASSDSSDSDADEQDTASSNVTGDESGTGAEEESDLVTEQPSAGNSIIVTENSGDVPTVLADGVETYANTNADGTLTYNGYQLFHGEDTASQGITINVFDYDTVIMESNDRESSPINFDGNSRRPFLFLYDPGSENRDMGNYSRNAYIEGVREDIVGDELTGGYPQLAGNGNGLTSSNRSLAYLFDPDQEVSGKTTYANANYLFQKDEQGYYYFDSETNFATLIPKADNEVGNNFWLYPNASNVWVYNYSNDRQTTNQVPQFMPFNTIARAGDRYDQGNGHTGNYHFGMTVEFDFLLPENGELEDGSDMTFEFTGDDDVWVYIDGHRVLDLGGIHPSQSGTINFATGEVQVNDRTTGYVWDLVGMTKEQWNATEYQTHNLKFFYLERGAGGSNCKLKFNMPTIPSNSVAVTKRVTGDAPDNASYTMQFAAQDTNFDYSQITWNVSSGEPQSLGENNTFTVNAGQTVYVNGIPDNTQYQIHELDIASDVIGVTINGKDKTPAQGSTSASSDVLTSGNNDAVIVTNTYPVQPPEGFGINVDKSATRDPSDSSKYTLSLSMTGDRDNQSSQKAVDILFVIDRSGSMDDPIDPEADYWERESRISAVRDAIELLVDTIEEKRIAGEVDPRYSVVAFAGAVRDEYRLPVIGTQVSDAGTACITDGWTSSGTTVTNAVNRMEVVGGTNWDYAIQMGQQQLNTIISQNEQTGRDAEQIVIFLSDGVPTYAGSDDSTGNGNESGDVEGCKNAAVTAVKSMSCDRFYAVGIGPDFVQDEDGYKYMNELRNAVPNATTDIFSAQNPNDLTDKFEDIAQSLTFFSCVDVVMTDQLSQWADLAQSQGNVTFTVQLERYDRTAQDYVVIDPAQSVNAGTSATFDANNAAYSDYLEETVVITPSVTYPAGAQPIITAAITGENGAEYEIEPGLRYTVKTMITPSEAAITTFEEKGEDAYTATGEENTGTHDGQPGYLSNNESNAQVSYNVKVTTDGVASELPGTEPFPKPVIQVDSSLIKPMSAELTLSKTFVGLTDEDVYYILFGQGSDNANFSFDINFCDTDMKKNGNLQDHWMVVDQEGKSDISLEEFDKPGTNETVTTGDHFKVYASKCLNDPGSADKLSEASNLAMGAKLEKEGDNWVYTQTITIPTTPDDEATQGESGHRYFYTVYELHGELPGYAKLDPDSAEYTVQLNADENGNYADTWTGRGKFVQTKGVSTPLVNMTGEDEQNGIANNELARLHITGDTTISFTNYYTDSMSITKQVTENGGTASEELLDELTEDKEYTVTIEPMDRDKLLKNDRGPNWNTKLQDAGITFQFGNEENPSKVHSQSDVEIKDGVITLKLYRGETVTLNNVPAINYAVTELGAQDDTENYYWSGVTYGEDYSHSKVDNGPRDDQYDGDPAAKDDAVNKDNSGADHWNGYTNGEDYGYEDNSNVTQDGKVSVDVDLDKAELTSVDVTLINDYEHYKTVTIQKQVDVGNSEDIGMGDRTKLFDFTTSVKRDTEEATEVENVTEGAGGQPDTLKLLNGETVNIDLSNQSASWETENQEANYSLANGGSLTISKLKKGDVITFAELDADSDGYSTSYVINVGETAGTSETTKQGDTIILDDDFLTTGEGEKAVLNDTVTIVYTNNRKVVAPTGLESNHTTPYVLMITAAGMAGLALIGGIVARRIRRRREE